MDDSEETQGTHFYLLRTTTTQEDAVVEMLYQKATLEGKDTGVYAMLHPGPIKGYVFMEARDLGDAIQLVQGVPHTKGFVKGEVDFDKEVKPLLTPKSSVLDVTKGDLIELIAGPFKGEKAKVIRVDQGKEEVTVELIEATVPIPVTAKGMHIKVVDRVTQEKAEESQKRELSSSPVIGEGPLPPLRRESDFEEEDEKKSGKPEEKKSGKKEKKIVLGMTEEKEKKTEESEDENIDEEKLAEEDANYFGGDDKDEDLDKLTKDD